MAMIDTVHAEWAVVERLRTMLIEQPHRKFNVTQSYGLCCSILAWVMQRIRSPEGDTKTAFGKAAIALKSKLEDQSIEGPPWGIKTSSVDTRETAIDFVGWNAFDFLVWLRNGICHGDARQITPVNEGNTLVGFRITANKSKNDKHSCTLVLYEDDLRRIGSSLASFYCQDLEGASGGGMFSNDAKALKESRKIA
jgi:hypothetical protein